MSGSVDQWVARERIKIAEDDAYGYGLVRYDPGVKRYRSVKALEDPEYSIAPQTLPVDRLELTILNLIRETVEPSTDDSANVQTSAQKIADLVISQPPHLWYATYSRILAKVLSAAKGVDGRIASRRFAELVSALARLGDLTNPSLTDLSYDIGEFWVRRTVIGPQEALTGEGGLRMWSEMPDLQLWIREELERFELEHNWPDQSWENFTCFCRELSGMYIEGLSPISSMWAADVLNFLRHYVHDPNTFRTPARRRLAAVYLDVFGEELYECKIRSTVPGLERQSDGDPESESTTLENANDEVLALDEWKSLLRSFRSHSVSASASHDFNLEAKAVARMQEIESM